MASGRIKRLLAAHEAPVPHTFGRTHVGPVVELVNVALNWAEEGGRQAPAEAPSLLQRQLRCGLHVQGCCFRENATQRQQKREEHDEK